MDVILDTETTGLKDHDQIIEISIINTGFGVDNWPAGAFEYKINYKIAT